MFELSPHSDGSWTEQVLYSFQFPENPIAGVTIDRQGNLFGVTGGNGQVFKLAPAGNGHGLSTLLHRFSGNLLDRAPMAYCCWMARGISSAQRVVAGRTEKPASSSRSRNNARYFLSSKAATPFKRSLSVSNGNSGSAVTDRNSPDPRTSPLEQSGEERTPNSEKASLSVIRTCKSCNTKNRVPAKHLSHTGTCGKCKTPLPPADEPLNVDAAEFDEIVGVACPGAGGFLGGVVRTVPYGGSRVAQTAKNMAGKAVVVKVTLNAIRTWLRASRSAVFPTLRSSPADAPWCSRPAWSIIIRWKTGLSRQRRFQSRKSAPNLHLSPCELRHRSN